MRLIPALVASACLAGCANIDPERLQRALEFLNQQQQRRAQPQPYFPGPGVMDITFAWDQFYNDQFQLVWMCRGEQTGQFVPVDRCALLPKVDLRWPDKTAPWRK